MSAASPDTRGALVVVRSPAKLNLDLLIHGRRDDGYHEIESTLVAVDRCDRVELRRIDGAYGAVELALDGPAATADVPRDPSNLASRAAARVLKLAHERALVPPAVGLAVSIEKHVPARAGLGGGSSNAAAAALGAAELLGIDPDDPALFELLSALGADCAFFLAARKSGAARCRGRGELVEPLALPPTPRAFVVLTPAVGSGAAEVYGALAVDELGPDRAPLDLERWLAAPLEEARALLFNALEAPALRKHQALAGWRAFLDGAGASHFRLAGSGSSFFGIFADENAARAFRDELLVATKARDHGLRAVFVARPLRAGVSA